MIWDKNFGLDYFGCLDTLLGSHCIWLVDREYGYVNLPQFLHFRQHFRIAGHIDDQVADFYEVAVAIALRMKLEVVFGSVVCRDSLDMHPAIIH